MKERPILFNGPMVRAILDGNKTQTRRIMKPQPEHGDSHVWSFGDFIWSDRELCFPVTPGQALAERCPFGKSGDRIWVRETHSVRVRPEDATDGNGRVWYAADKIGHDLRWTPSIHMPKWATRITLDVTSVRIERLQAISDADAESEGIDFLRHLPDADERLTASQLFMCLWDSVATPGADWAANPWVWVVEFRRADA